MRFGKLQEIRFGTATGSYSQVTDREHEDSQITLTDYEADLLIGHFGRAAIHTGNVGSNPALSSKNFRLYPSGQQIRLNVVFPKPGKTELRLYLAQRAGFKPHGGQVWFLFLRGQDIWVGALEAEDWIRERNLLREDDGDSIFQQQIEESSELQITKLKARDVFARDRQIALNRFELSGYRCEYDHSCRLFISRATGRNYLEAHHLVPMGAQSQFTKTLDHIENVFSLCPHHHRAIHHAERAETRNMLNVLSNKRPVLAGYNLDSDDLANLYGVEELD